SIHSTLLSFLQPPPQPSTLFPYTTLFRSRLVAMPEELAKRKLSRQSVLDTSYDSFKKALELNGSDNLVAAKADLGMAAVEEDRRSEEHTSELQSPYDLVCRLLLEKKKIYN